MVELSPAAQAVLDAYKNAPDLMVDGDSDEVERRLGIAAALRAAADQVMPGRPHPHRTQLLAIATELETHQ